MPSYKTLVRILIATSVASSTLAAPIMSEEEVEVLPRSTGSGSSVDLSEPATYPPTPVPVPVPARPEPKPPFAWKTAGFSGIAGTVLGFVGTTLIWESLRAHAHNQSFPRSVEDRGPIPHSLASSSDEHLLLVRDISRSARALEDLD